MNHITIIFLNFIPMAEFWILCDQPTAKQLIEITQRQVGVPQSGGLIFNANPIEPMKKITAF